MIDEAPDVFEDDDLLEMVNAGLVPITIVDDYLANFWSKVFTHLQVHGDVALRSGGNLGDRVPQGESAAPRGRQQLARQASARVTPSATPSNGAISKAQPTPKMPRQTPSAGSSQAVVALFKKYGAEYNVDYLLMAAQGYQESTLDQNVKSPVGAIGVMQVMPPTGRELNVGDITKVDANIHAGVKYMRFMMDRYYANEPMDDLNKVLMTFASYNAGPGRITAAPA